MTHLSVLVVCPDGTTIDDHVERVTALLAPYDANHGGTWVTSDVVDGGGYWDNPDGIWDRWRIGGRWSGYFSVARGLDDTDLAQVVVAKGLDPRDPGGRANGGPMRCLDLDVLRDRGGREAAEEWDAYAAATAGTEQHVHWSEFAARVEASAQAAALALGGSRAELIDRCGRQACEELGLTPDDHGWPAGAGASAQEVWSARRGELWAVQDARWARAQTYSVADARVEYGEQARVRAARSADAFRNLFALDLDRIDLSTRDEYEARARVLMVSPAVIVRPDGRWWAQDLEASLSEPFGSWDERQAFAAKANAYLDALSGDTFVVAVDCHT